MKIDLQRLEKELLAVDYFWDFLMYLQMADTGKLQVNQKRQLSRISLYLLLGKSYSVTQAEKELIKKNKKMGIENEVWPLFLITILAQKTGFVRKKENQLMLTSLGKDFLQITNRLEQFIIFFNSICFGMSWIDLDLRNVEILQNSQEYFWDKLRNMRGVFDLTDYMYSLDESEEFLEWSNEAILQFQIDFTDSILEIARLFEIVQVNHDYILHPHDEFPVPQQILLTDLGRYVLSHPSRREDWWNFKFQLKQSLRENLVLAQDPKEVQFNYAPIRA